MTQQTNPNDIFNEILISLLKEIHNHLSATEEVSTIEASLVFDETHRISIVENFLVNDSPKVADFNLLEKLNKVAVELNSLPEIYRLKKCTLSLTPDGEVGISPTYVQE